MTQGKLTAFAMGAGAIGAMLCPPDAHAQRRAVVHRAPARGTVHVGVGVGARPYYRPYYRSYYYRPYYYGYGGWPYYPWYPYGWGFGVGYGYGYGYGWPAPYAYGPAYYDISSSLRIQVEPRETEVFIDGYWAGTVDDFYGFFQRLHLEPGEHELELYLQGHRSIKQKVYLQPNATFRVRHTMVPLAPGEASDPRPVPRATSQPGRYDAFGRRQGPPPAREGATADTAPPERAEADAFGALAVRVQPRDAEIVIDGERWDSPPSAERLVVELPEGEHRVEIRKDGFETYVSTVRVRRGETTTVNVSLARE